MQRKVSFTEGEYYHLYNRGVDRRNIFSTVGDYKRFMALLCLANSSEDVRIGNLLRTSDYEEIITNKQTQPIIAIGAFCLMPNHFHILATPLTENGISRYMLKLQTGYSMYFNTKNDRNGSLFQGPFKAEHVDDDRYLKYLFSYIHLNPAKLKDRNWKENMKREVVALQRFVENYPYSSLREYISNSHAITNPTFFPKYFQSIKEFYAHTADWLQNEQG